MGTTADKLNKVLQTKEAIRQSINAKGVEVTNIPFAQYASKIDQISGGSDDEPWQPDPLWWDIKAIAQADAEQNNWAAARICLLSASDVSTTFEVGTSNLAKIITSDGATYTASTTHTWDAAQDKESSDFYKTRYYIEYYDAADISVAVPLNCLYFIQYKGGMSWKPSGLNSLLAFNFLNDSNLSATLTNLSAFCISCASLRCLPDVLDVSNATNLSYFCSNCRVLKYMPSTLDASNVTDFSNFCVNCYALKKLPDVLNVSKGTNFSNFCYYCYALEKLPATIDVSKGTNFSYFFGSCYSLQKLPDVLDVSKGTNFSNFCASCYSLQKLPDVLDISNSTNAPGFCSSCSSLQLLPAVLETAKSILSGFCSACYSLVYINLTELKTSITLQNSNLLSHDVLVNWGQNIRPKTTTSTVTITLGYTNFAKLNDAEKALFTSKGYTLAAA